MFLPSPPLNEPLLEPEPNAGIEPVKLDFGSPPLFK